MNKREFIDLLALRCENRQDPDWDIIVNAEASNVQRNEIEANGQIYPWFLESEWAQASTVKGEERLPLPLDFLSEIEGQVMQIQVDGVWRDLEKRRYDEMIQIYRQCEGVPAMYDLVGINIVFAPIPDKEYPVRMRCFRRDVPFNQLGDGDTNLILTHASDWLLACTGRVIAANHLHNDVLSAKFDLLKQEASARVFAISQAREHTNRTYRMEPK